MRSALKMSSAFVATSLAAKEGLVVASAKSTMRFHESAAISGTPSARSGPRQKTTVTALCGNIVCPYRRAKGAWFNVSASTSKASTIVALKISRRFLRLRSKTSYQYKSAGNRFLLRTRSESFAYRRTFLRNQSIIEGRRTNKAPKAAKDPGAAGLAIRFRN